MQSLQERFTTFYGTLGQESLGRIGQLYHDAVTFRDPVAAHEGLAALESYFRRLLSGGSDCRFVIHEQDFGSASAWVRWTMTFCHPRLNRGRLVAVSGVSLLRFTDDRITEQEDFYDLGAMLYEQLPVIGPVVRFLRRRLAA
jgi:hypothetical protein